MAEEEKKEEQNIPETPAPETPASPTEGTPAPEEGAAQTPAEGTPAPEEPAKHKYADKLSKEFPDREFKSPEDYDKGMEEYLGSLEDYRERGQMTNQKLLSIFDAEPQVGEIIRDMTNGATFREALARHVSPEDITAVEGDPDYEGWNKNKSAREENLTKRKTAEETYNQNLEFSQQAIEAFAEENGMDDEAAGKFLGKLDAMLADINQGRISKETLLTMKKAWDYDSDIEKARSDGQLSQRNAEIVAQREKKQPEGDGLPRLKGSSDTPEQDNPQPQYIDGLLSAVDKRKVLD